MTGLRQWIKAAAVLLSVMFIGCSVIARTNLITMRAAQVILVGMLALTAVMLILMMILMLTVALIGYDR